MSWHLQGAVNVTKALKWQKRNHHTRRDERNKNMMTIMNLVRESKVRGVDEGKVWKTLLKHRWNIEILRTNSCLNETQILDVIYKTGQDLNLMGGSNIWNWIPEENLDFGIKLYSSLHYCPKILIEKAKLVALYESLLANHNLATVVAATMHNIQPRAGNNIKDFTEINMWYQRLDERYNFALGKAILPLMTTERLRQLENYGNPFWGEAEALVNTSSTASSNFGKIEIHLI